MTQRKREYVDRQILAAERADSVLLMGVYLGGALSALEFFEREDGADADIIRYRGIVNHLLRMAAGEEAQAG